MESDYMQFTIYLNVYYSYIGKYSLFDVIINSIIILIK